MVGFTQAARLTLLRVVLFHVAALFVVVEATERCRERTGRTGGLLGSGVRSIPDVLRVATQCSFD